MKDQVDFADRLAQHRRLEEISPKMLDASRPVWMRRTGVENANPEIKLPQGQYDAVSDESGPTCDEDSRRRRCVEAE
jgi:hypothetical protein